MREIDYQRHIRKTCADAEREPEPIKIAYLAEQRAAMRSDDPLAELIDRTLAGIRISRGRSGPLPATQVEPENRPRLRLVKR